MAYIESSYRNRPRRQFREDRHIKPYRAIITWRGRRVYLGYYATVEAARTVEQNERRRYEQEAIDGY